MTGKKSTVYAGQYTLDFSLAHGTVRERPIKKFHIRSLVFFKPVFLQAAFWEIINLTGWTSWSRQLLTGSKQHNNTETGNMQLAVTALKNIKLEWQLQFQASLGRKLKRTLLYYRTSKKKKNYFGKVFGEARSLDQASFFLRLFHCLND